MKLLLTCLVVAFALFSCVNAQGNTSSICDRYSRQLSLTNNGLISTLVSAVVANVTAVPGIRVYFNGTTPAGSVNFLTNTTAYNILAGHLIAYFGQALGCSDGTIGAYNGRNMVDAHATLQINYFAYAGFNTLLVQTAGTFGVNTTDQATIASVLNGFYPAVCKAADCATICNKYSQPFLTNNAALVTAVVTGTVQKALASNNLLRFFNGTTPAGSINFLTNTTAYGILASHLVQFFGSALGCSDGSIGSYTGNINMQQVHANMPINNATFVEFNNAVLTTLAGAGVVTADVNAVGSVLEGLRGAICNQPDCQATATSNGGSSNGGSTNTVNPTSQATQAATTAVDDSAFFAPLILLIGSFLIFF